MTDKPNAAEMKRAIRQLKACKKIKDTAQAHRHADAILCTFVAELGYTDVAAQYILVYKEYE